MRPEKDPRGAETWQRFVRVSSSSAVAGCLVMTGLAGCDADGGGPGSNDNAAADRNGPLQAQIASRIRLINPRPGEGVETTFAASITPCVSSGDPIRLDEVVAVRPSGGATITDFGMVLVGQEYGDLDQPLSSISVWKKLGTTVSRRCDSSDLSASLAVEVTKPSLANATVDSLIIRYSVGDSSYEEPVDLSLTLCEDYGTASCPGTEGASK